jgi:hypothetical protein
MRSFSFWFLAVSLLCAQPADPPAPAKPKPERPFLPGSKWRANDPNRPLPPKVDPGAPMLPLPPPSDAIVLFDGKDLSEWTAVLKNQTIEPGWKVQDGYMEVVPGTGALVSKRKFGSAQYHIEWAAPPEIKGSGQRRGNSGIILMRRYELQVLDSWDNPTYADGMVAAFYGQYPPLVNASRKPGEWQSYDIIFEAPVFSGDQLVKPPYATVLHNGVVVHHHVKILGRTRTDGSYLPHGPEEPLMLQNHGGDAVRFRNIWVRPLRNPEEP